MKGMLYRKYLLVLDALNAFDGGNRSVLGPVGTGGIFCTYPQRYLSISGGLWDQVRKTEFCLVNLLERIVR